MDAKVEKRNFDDPAILTSGSLRAPFQKSQIVGTSRFTIPRMMDARIIGICNIHKSTAAVKRKLTHHYRRGKLERGRSR